MENAKSYFMGADGFVWFVGVVEDRNDPDQQGRVRVRCLGYHSQNHTEVPTSDLPWAHVMHPVTDPSMHGMGNSPSWLIEGSWIIGFFRDAIEKQQPIIIGSLPGQPANPADFRTGFNDPRHKESTQTNDKGIKQYAANPEDEAEYGPYPLGALKDTKDEKKGKFSRFSGHTVGETDTSRLGRGVTSEDHASLSRRRKLRRTKIPTATRPFIPSVEDLSVDGTDKADVMVPWDELHPKGLTKDASPYKSARYPYNHVYESESGHLMEIDDTPSGERLHREHMSGTFEEIHPKGDKVVKVVGSNYEIIAGSSNVVISGNVNVTIEGTKKELIKGDYILEVEGDFTRKIHMNERVKIGAGPGGNLEEEVVGNNSFNINGAVKGRINKDSDTTIVGNQQHTVEGYQRTGVTGDIGRKSTKGSIMDEAFVNYSQTTVSGIMSIKSGTTGNFKTASIMTIHSEAATNWTSVGLVTETFQASHTNNTTGTFDLNVSVEVDVDSALINLN
jgi:hypothetical protein